MHKPIEFVLQRYAIFSIVPNEREQNRQIKGKIWVTGKIKKTILAFNFFEKKIVWNEPRTAKAVKRGTGGVLCGGVPRFCPQHHWRRCQKYPFSPTPMGKDVGTKKGTKSNV